MPLQSITSPDVTTQRTLSDSALSRWLLLASGLWCVCWFIHGLHDWEDDAYIHLEFARNLAAGHGYSFNGLLVNGDTSPLWVLLLAGVHTLVPNWMIAGKLLAVLGVVFALTGTYFFAKRLTSDVEGNGRSTPSIMRGPEWRVSGACRRWRGALAELFGCRIFWFSA